VGRSQCNRPETDWRTLANSKVPRGVRGRQVVFVGKRKSNETAPGLQTEQFRLQFFIVPRTVTPGQSRTTPSQSFRLLQTVRESFVISVRNTGSQNVSQRTCGFEVLGSERLGQISMRLKITFDVWRGLPASAKLLGCGKCNRSIRGAWVLLDT